MNQTDQAKTRLATEDSYPSRFKILIFNDGNVKAMKRGKGAESLTACKDSMKVRMKLQIPSQHQAPVVVHLRSPKIIKVRPEEFRALVQQLTGNQASMLS